VLNASFFCILEARKYLWRVIKKFAPLGAVSLPDNASVTFPLSAQNIVPSSRYDNVLPINNIRHRIPLSGSGPVWPGGSGAVQNAENQTLRLRGEKCQDKMRVIRGYRGEVAYK
jgi:hypothetical protein